MASSVRVLFGDSRATPAVLIPLRDTGGGKMVSLASRGDERWGEEEDSETEGEEDRPGPPESVPYSMAFLCLFFGS